MVTTLTAWLAANPIIGGLIAIFAAYFLYTNKDKIAAQLGGGTTPTAMTAAGPTGLPSLNQIFTDISNQPLFKALEVAGADIKSTFHMFNLKLMQNDVAKMPEGDQKTACSAAIATLTQMEMEMAPLFPSPQPGTPAKS
jgi:hypothetical protein